ETADQPSWLQSARCDEAQGLLFSRAVPWDEFVQNATPDRAAGALMQPHRRSGSRDAQPG
ncbi:MAG: hypothetical protein ACR2OH_11625, partial [Microthrixaceae bacterium]